MASFKYRTLGQFVQTSVLGPFLRKIANILINGGLKIEGKTASRESILPDQREISVYNHKPDVSSSFIAANSTLIGNVKLGSNNSVLFGSSIETTSNDSSVKIGNFNYISDLVSVKANLGRKTIIGDDCFISSRVSIENSIIEDGVFIGIGAQINDGCYLEKNSFIAAGSIIEQGTRIKSGFVVAGSPARQLREVNKEEKEYLRDLKDQFNKLGKIIQEETEKDENDYKKELEFTSVDDFDGMNFHKKVNQWVNIAKEKHYPVSPSDFHSIVKPDIYMNYVDQSLGQNATGSGFDELDSNIPYSELGRKSKKLVDDIEKELLSNPNKQQMEFGNLDKEKYTLNDEKFRQKDL